VEPGDNPVLCLEDDVEVDVGWLYCGHVDMS